jgi:hypothetical protein
MMDELTPAVKRQIRLPIANSGLGIPTSVSRSAPSWIAGIALAAPLIRTALPESCREPNSPLVRAITRVRNTVVGVCPLAGAQHGGLPIPKNFLRRFTDNPDLAAQLQKRFTKHTNKADLAALRAAVNTKTHLARILAFNSRHSNAWLYARPTSSNTTLSDHEMSIAVRNRLCLPPIPLSHMPTTCACGTLFNLDHWHPLTCVKIKRGRITTRHDHIVQLIAAFARSFQALVHVESRPLLQPGEARLRPDLSITFNTETYWIDVVVPYPCAPSRILRKLTTAAHSVNVAAKSKRKYYKKFCALHGGKILGFAVDAFGVWGQDADKLVAWIRKKSKSPSSRLPPNWSARVTTFRREVSVAIQQGNAMAVAYCFDRADGL